MSETTFIAAPVSIFGLQLRPYTHGSRRQFEKCCATLRDRLNQLYGESPEHDAKCADGRCWVQCKRYRRSLDAQNWIVGLFVYLHAGKPAEVLRNVWDETALMLAVDSLLAAQSDKAIEDADAVIAKIIQAARDADNYRVEASEGEAPPDPNSSTPTQTPATSGTSPG
jgi:hypothetical protein